jgi:hypothetical protein
MRSHSGASTCSSGSNCPECRLSNLPFYGPTYKRPHARALILRVRHIFRLACNSLLCSEWSTPFRQLKPSSVPFSATSHRRHYGSNRFLRRPQSMCAPNLEVEPRARGRESPNDSLSPQNAGFPGFDLKYYSTDIAGK